MIVQYNCICILSRVVEKEQFWSKSFATKDSSWPYIHFREFFFRLPLVLSGLNAALGSDHIFWSLKGTKFVCLKATQQCKQKHRK